ncbi:MAG: hypothetical protein LC794_14325 [Acidobacteria bacterium]|nr:hypothetical protein [Acidobacteriota bacterium]MCA1627851.1 hypothetical protein [Acidobacteriota bacterium]
MSTSFNPQPANTFRNRAFIAGGVLLLVLVALAFLDSHQFFQAYLVGWTFWTGIAVGSLALLMLQHMTGGGWGFVIRRVLEASTRTLPIMALLFIPIILGAHSIYEWTHQEVLEQHPVVAFKTPYLNLTFFIVRAVVYFAVWIALAFFLNRWSLAQDRTADVRYTKNMRVLSGPGMIALIFTITFASVDWYMSLEPEWYSTIYGFIFVASWSLSALAFVIAVMAWLIQEEPLSRVVAPLHFHDLGKLLLALVMLWSYFAFSQYLIIWSGNLPEEIGYYLERTHGLWGAVIIAIGILHFAAPFLFLLSRELKRNPRRLVMVALLVLVMRMIDLLWMLVPAFHEHRWIWLDVIALLGFGGLWLGLFAWQLAKRPLIPINDPQFESVMATDVHR